MNQQLPKGYENPNEQPAFKTGRTMPVKNADFVALEADFVPPLPEPKPFVRIGVVNWLNYMQFQSPGEVNNQPSLTVPGQGITVTQMLENAKRGLPITLKERPAFYEYDEKGNKIQDLPDLNKLDLSERYDLVRRLNDRVKQIRDELQNPKPVEQTGVKEPQKGSQGVSDAPKESSDSAKGA